MAVQSEASFGLAANRPALRPINSPICSAICIFFFTNELRLRHIGTASKSAVMPGRDTPRRVFCMGLRACVRAPSKSDSSHEIRERTKPKGSSNFAGLLARPSAPQSTPARFSCYFPALPCYFRSIPRLRIDFITDLHFARPHLQGFTGTSHDGEWRIIGAAIKAAKDGDVGAMRLCWDRFAPVPRNAPDVPELAVIHINFIRIMTNALDRGQLVLPKRSNVAKEISFAAAPWSKALIASQPRHGAHRAELESLFSPVINRRG
jgi:hypothetical protein